jgi:hypothetical protein
MRPHSFFCSAALVLSMLCASPSARAEDAAKAATLAEAGAARARQGDRRVAIDLYDEAYAAAPRREYLREVGALYDRLAIAGDARDVRLAIVYYERYLLTEDPMPDRAAVQARVVGLRAWKAKMPAEPTERPPAQMPLHVLAYNAENSYEVALGGSSCTTPCTIMVAPGASTIRTRGAGELDLQVAVPPRPSQIRLQHTESSGYVAGAVLLPTGIVVGASLWAVGLACSNNDGCLLGNLIAWPVLGASMMITGIVLLARGKVTPAPDANRVEIIARGGKPQLWLTSAGFTPAPHGGGTTGVGFAF